MPALSSELRNKLASAVKDAREVGERGAEAALVALEVGEKEARSGMAEDQRKLRVRLRAHGRQLGDVRQANGTQSTTRLKREIAYQHWHRMLFGRFLAENNLLMHPEHGVALSINDCRNLAEEEGRDLWEMVGSFAQGCLPQIFRGDDPALAVKLAPEHLLELEALLAALPSDVFTADDSLGWVYQFWQAEEKDRVNKGEVPIGADELPAVTQLFTEHYMVQFLLHNTLGAWHAAKVLEADPDLAKNAETEQELRDAVALPDYTWDYLRFVRENDNSPWHPAAGSFSEWPRQARDLKTLDPCCGSGHFLVELFTILLALREHEEGRLRLDLIREVLRHNLSGLELDARCTQIAAFALALASWKAAGEVLPDIHLNVACSGISVGDDKMTWLKLAGADQRAREAMERLFELFQQAPLLGSLIDPVRAVGDVFAAGFSQVRPFIENAVGEAGDDEQREAGIAALSVAEAIRNLTDHYHLVATNVPYLGRSKQALKLKEYCETHHRLAKNDLSTCFADRALQWCTPGGTTALVTPQNWLFLARYEQLRRNLLLGQRWNIVVRLGEHAFESPAAAGAFAAMVVMTRKQPEPSHSMAGLDVSAERAPADKAIALRVDNEHRSEPTQLLQSEQVKNPDSRVVLEALDRGSLLQKHANSWQGIKTSDDERFTRMFWESAALMPGWTLYQRAPRGHVLYDGRSELLFWEDGLGQLTTVCQQGASFRGKSAWGRVGIAVSMMRGLPGTVYTGEKFSADISIIDPLDQGQLAPFWLFCTSPDYYSELRKIDPALRVTNTAMAKVPIELSKWRAASAEMYPQGLPAPQTNDPLQWLFLGHPSGMLAAGSSDRSPFGVADAVGADRHASLVCRDPNPAAVLQVAVARLLGYRWPAELDPEMRLDEAQRAWVERCAELAEHADADGIVCFDRLHGEDSAGERIVKLLRAAFGEHWTDGTLRQLIKATGSKATTIDAWLRKDFFAQHCKTFHNRPFIWHIWDGLPDGFNALVNYHKLAGPDGEGQRTMTTLTFTYLNDWIKKQRQAVADSEDGADERLACAVELQEQLKNIIEGEPYYDIFVRWKPLHKQPIGWEPDINDGVRINIRPFMKSELRRGKKDAGILRVKPNIHWKKDRGKEPQRPKEDFPWFWSWDEETDDFAGGKKFDANRWNDLHYSREFKQAARDRHEGTA